MFSQASVKSKSTLLSFRQAFVLVLGMWLVYALLFVLYLPEPWASILGFVPGIIGVSGLLLSGFSKEHCYLRMKMLSLAGFAILVALFLAMIPVIFTGLTEASWTGWDWIAALIYAPASGITQELYFRSALLPALEAALGRSRLALVISSLMFSFFHLGMVTVAPSTVVISSLIVTLIVGLGWGWQVQRDHTSIWAMVHHGLLQIILRLFAWG